MPFPPLPPFLWEQLPQSQRPVVLYGMGDGAEKVLALCARYGVEVRGVFASDDFVRGQSFRGFPVERLADLERRLGKMTVLLAFASNLPQVLEQIEAIAARHELLAPDLPVAGEGLFTPDYAAAHREQLEAARALLADDWSVHTFDSLLCYKLSGEIAPLRSCAVPKNEIWDLLRPGPQEVYVDAGAYTGDTLEEFLMRTGGHYRQVLALEPDVRNFRRLTQTAGRLAGELGREPDSIRCLNVGAWSGPDTLSFTQRSGRAAALGTGLRETAVDSIDRLLQGEAPTLIKYDVEGAEARAVAGSAESIRRHAPGLIVSAYHRVEDLFALPLALHALQPAYRLYLRHHPYLPGWDVNYCAIL